MSREAPGSDLRIRRTQKLLRETLLQLLNERAFDAITVGEIASRAMVNRATFYRHYRDKEELAESIFEGAVEDLLRQLGPARPGRRDVRPDQLLGGWAGFFEHIGRNRPLYRAMLSNRADPRYAARIRAKVMSIAQRRLRDARRPGVHGEMPDEVALAFAMNALMGTVTWWLERDTPYAPAQMAAWYLRFGAIGYLRALGIDPGDLANGASG